MEGGVPVSDNLQPTSHDFLHASTVKWSSISLTHVEFPKGKHEMGYILLMDREQAL